GGCVALMRHALVMFCSNLGVKMNWYIFKSNTKASRIAAANRNTLQGVADREARFGENMEALLHEWARTDAKYDWLSPGGPLAPVGVRKYKYSGR
ncbi:hypothetical protein HOY80DRAFT_897338, partial [Tuber brumale]